MDGMDGSLSLLRLAMKADSASVESAFLDLERMSGSIRPN